MVSRYALVGVALLLVGFGAVGSVGAAAPVPLAHGAALSGVSPVKGNLSGPTVGAPNGNYTYYVNGSGGPAIASNGTMVGQITWKATTTGTNVTGVTVSPSSGSLTPRAPAAMHLKLSKLLQTVVLKVVVTSTFGGVNATLNLTKSVQLVTPYVVRAMFVVGPSASILPFTVAVLLDGTPVAHVPVPAIPANDSYNFTYDYATLGLSPGWHTFTISLASEHGLVTFGGGATQYSQSFYVTGPPPNYALWVILGLVVFFGVLFIFATRLAARRRPPSRK